MRLWAGCQGASAGAKAYPDLCPNAKAHHPTLKTADAASIQLAIGHAGSANKAPAPANSCQPMPVSLYQEWMEAEVVFACDLSRGRTRRRQSYLPFTP